VVTLDRVTVSVDGRRILGPVSVSVQAGERWVILGPNGSGKTTLLSIVGARRQPTTGSVTVMGVPFGRADIRTLHASIGHVSHALTERFPPAMTVRDVVLTGKRAALSPWFQRYDETDLDRAGEVLEVVGCGAIADRVFLTCSQGERQRVLLARATFGRPPLLVLDESAAGLDLPARESLITAIGDAIGDDPALVVVMATHHLEEIPPSATHALLLRDGGVVAAGPIGSTITDDALARTFDLAIAVERRGGRWTGFARGAGD
jgi:iron complex transport system ATP-binding protein